YQALDTFGAIDSLSSIEHIITGAGDDQVFGSAAPETIQTGAGNDFIRGGGGGDTLIGGPGDDTYSRASPGDVIIEQPNEGIDTITTIAPALSLMNYANVENLRGLANTGQTLTGNDLDNLIRGGSGNDTLDGGAGTDTADYAFSNTGVAV